LVADENIEGGYLKIELQVKFKDEVIGFQSFGETMD
jgi:hypothetical protein